MSTIPVSYRFAIDDRVYEVERLSGTEAISRPFRFELMAVLEPGDPTDPEQALWQSVALELRRDRTIRTIRGVVSSAARRASVPGTGRQSELRLTFEPPMALLRHRTDLRVFRDLSIPELVGKVVRPMQEIELRLAGSHKPRAYVVQHRETDFAFISRWMEREGLFYFFDQDGKMILADAASAYDETHGVLSFAGAAALDARKDAALTVGRNADAGADRLELRDLRLDRLDLDMDLTTSAPGPRTARSYDFPGGFSDPDEGRDVVRRSAERAACAGSSIVLDAIAPRLAPGGSFQLEGAPGGLEDGEWVATELAHDYERRGTAFRVRVHAIDAELAFRPPRLTPWPVVEGPLPAFVTGSPGEDIATDEWGRVKVHFPWDRVQPLDDRCSDWTWVLQENTGSSCAIPRVGWEVLVHHVEGDPDQPIVMGRLFNPRDPFHENLPGFKTRSAIRSLTSPTRSTDRFHENRIAFDDYAGAQFLHFQAERDQTVVVQRDKDDRTIHHETRVVHGNESHRIDGRQDMKIGESHTTNVGNLRQLRVEHDRDRRTTGIDSVSVDGDRETVIGSRSSRRVGPKDTVDVGKRLNERIGALLLEVSRSTHAWAARKLGAEFVGGALIELVGAEKAESSGRLRIDLVGGAALRKAKDAIRERIGGARLATVLGDLSVTAGKNVLFAAKEKLSIRAGQIEMEIEEKIALEVDDTNVVLEKGTMTMTSSDRVLLSAREENLLGSQTSEQVP